MFFKKSKLCLAVLFFVSLQSQAIDLSQISSLAEGGSVDLSNTSSSSNIVKQKENSDFKINDEQPMISKLDYIRDQFSVPPLIKNDSLQKAAVDHAYYLTKADQVTHSENNSNSFFTGETPIKRAMNQGYGSNSSFVKVGEVVSMYYGQEKDQDLDSFLVAIYHRFSILDPAFTDYGEARLTDGYRNIAEMTLGGTNNGQPLKYAYYPLNNESDVPTTFYPFQEEPNPMPGYNKVGYPVSFQVTDGYSLKISDFTLTDSYGNKISGQQLNNNNDTDVSNSEFAFIPYQELNSNETYTAKLSGTINDKENINASWKFTTAKRKDPLILTDKSVYQPGDEAKITYFNIPDPNVKIEVASYDSDQLLLKMTSKSNSWGYASFNILKGCNKSSGCKATFKLTLDNGQSYSKDFIIMP